MIEHKDFLSLFDPDFTLYYQTFKKNQQLHWHRYYELVYCLKGTVTVKTDQSSSIVGEGEILFIGAYEPHMITKSKNAMHLIIQFRSELVDPVFRPFFEIKYLIPMMNPAKVVKLSAKEQEFLKWMFDDIQFNYDHPSPASRMAIRGSIIRLMGFMINDRRLNIPGNSHYQSPQLSKILHVLYYLEDHYDETITEQQVADLAGYNYAYFSDLFKKIMGHTYSEHLNLVRLKAAKSLLLGTEKTIATISQEVGYQNLSYFNRMFKRHNQMTPRQYRQAK